LPWDIHIRPGYDHYAHTIAALKHTFYSKSTQRCKGRYNASLGAENNRDMITFLQNLLM
jgi:hypothetical protein